MDDRRFDEKVYKVFGERKKSTTENLLREIAIKLSTVIQELQLNRELMQEIRHVLTEGLRMQTVTVRELRKEKVTYRERYEAFVELAEKNKFLTAKQIARELRIDRETARRWMKKLAEEKPQEFRYISGKRGYFGKEEARLVNLKRLGV